MQFGRRNFKRRETNRRLSITERLTRIVAYIISLVSATALLLTIISPFIEPSKGGMLPILGLVAPAIYVVNVVLALYWIIYWRWRVALPILIVLALATLQSTLFIKVQLTKEYDTKSYRGMVRLMSYNVRSFYGDSGYDSEHHIAEYVEREKPDVICFQEFFPSKKRIFKRYAPSIAKYHQSDSEGLKIFSRYPIISSRDLLAKVADSLSGRSMVVDLLVGSDTLRIFNNHLQSTTITARDSRYLTSNMIVRDTNRNNNILNIIRRYTNSCEIRAKQVDAISQHIEQSPYPIVVCGDFNDTPASYSYRRMSKGLKDAFQECGKDYSYTYRGFFNLLRIDYILCSDEVTPNSYKVDREARYSDHLPVISHLKITNQE